MRAPLGIIATALGFGILAAACGDAGVGSNEDDATSIPYAEGSPEAQAIRAVANDQELGVEQYDSSDVVGLHKKAAENLVAHRDGDPNTPDDDDFFDSLAELWTVPYCKTSCMHSLLDYAKQTGVYGGNENISVIFSPQSGQETHLQGIADAIDDEADETIDIAMYSYSHQEPVKGALIRALDRGVKIRFLANTDLANSTSKAGALEQLGIDVRRVTKIMHHKFAIIDGPRDAQTLDRAADTFIVSGSGNWSSSAATIYDENTLFFTGYPEMALRLQRDFDYLWAGSKDVVHVEGLEWDQTTGNITDELIAQHEDANTHAYLTSFNFAPTSSQGWSVLGTTVVTDALVEVIGGAQSSIHIASGHFLNEPIADAIGKALESNPNLYIDIVLDCQETSKSGTIATLKNKIEDLGGTIQYKCNTYRWHYKFAKQMHHKYMIIDGEDLYTGSMNFSLNAEINTFENMMLFKGEEHRALVDSYLVNHDMVRSYGYDSDALTALMEEIETGSTVPLTWYDPIAMDLDTFRDMKDAIRDRCPATKSWLDTPEAKTYNALFNSQPHWFDECHTEGYAWPEVPVDMRIE
ncbi:MAG: hypothetical protein DRI90_13305 [Deltaproteobacteria bacterium]|nr:MAG: hypothetical protein DRI90_13305 [Deltaproteobacteria bacterium]